jgi:adenosylhomocysteine nucleosidase
MKIAIIAAMEREVEPLIRTWGSRPIEHDGRRYRLFESQDGKASLICGGIGAQAARRATEAVIEAVHPDRVISAGFAGALDESAVVGDVIEPRTVINAADGVRTDTGFGQGILLTSANTAGKDQKVRLRKAYDANAVDMEAGAVAQGARARRIEFGALKTISDAADFKMPAMESFVASDGSFRAAKFACHVALRPWLWMTTIRLARNSSMASTTLSSSIHDYLERETPSAAKSTPDSPALGEFVSFDEDRY